MFKTKSVFWLLALACTINTAVAQEVVIPDSGLEAAVRDALQKPAGSLTAQDLLTLTNLDASDRKISNAAGLENAQNLAALKFFHNQLANFSVPPEFTKLTALDLSFNAITNFSVPDSVTNITTLNLADNRFTDLALLPNLSGLTNLNIEDNGLTFFKLPSYMTNMVVLDVGFNSITNFVLPNGITRLDTLIAAGNLITNLALPFDITGLKSLNLHINNLAAFNLPPSLNGLTNLDLDENQLGKFNLPLGMINLVLLDLSFNQLTNLTLPGDLGNLLDLDLSFNEFTDLNLPAGLSALSRLHLRANQFKSFTLRDDLAALTSLDISECPLTTLLLPTNLNRLSTLNLSKDNLADLALPTSMTNLTAINLSENQLTNLVLPANLFHLQSLNLGGNELANLTLPPGLTNLTGLFVTGNNFTTLTLPPDMTQITALGFLANPLRIVVLPEPLTGPLADTIATLRSDGISVFIYPLTIELELPRATTDGFSIDASGPPGVYTLFASDDLVTWNELSAATNSLGAARFNDTSSPQPTHRFYRAQLQDSATPTNMVFIPANTFTLGSPINEPGRNSAEGPQTTVTFTHGFWISKFLVTQGDYLALMGSNPSGFPGDLNRPVESVNWFDATNYCAALTVQDSAAGRIPPGSHYRLPTEAEWECAARAGSTTRYYFGDDATSLTNYAWSSANSGFTTHPVGLKAPNAWGLYDMEGNLWEWCQDWFGPYPGGSVTDPHGPPSNPENFKVIRGAAWEALPADCRSARRALQGASQPVTVIGVRVVLAFDP